jgi:hypothetical protein
MPSLPPTMVQDTPRRLCVVDRGRVTPTRTQASTAYIECGMHPILLAVALLIQSKPTGLANTSLRGQSFIQRLSTVVIHVQMP